MRKSKVYIVQCSLDKGKTYFNVIQNDSLLGYDMKQIAKVYLNEYYENYKVVCKATNIKPVAKKWFRVKEFIEVE